MWWIHKIQHLEPFQECEQIYCNKILFLSMVNADSVLNFWQPYLHFIWIQNVCLIYHMWRKSGSCTIGWCDLIARSINSYQMSRKEVNLLFHHVNTSASIGGSRGKKKPSSPKTNQPNKTTFQKERTGYLRCFYVLIESLLTVFLLNLFKSVQQILSVWLVCLLAYETAQKTEQFLF